MKVEDVPEEWVQAAWEAWALTQDDAAGICMKHMLAAVIPAIQNAALERAAVVAETHEWGKDIAWWLQATKKDVAAEAGHQCAAAIRALKEGT
jgi:hypothetical protein